MQNNIFMISDASYSTKTKIAGLGVVDLSTKKKYQKPVQNMGSIDDAEFYALAYSVKIALENNYDNVVFVYDRMDMDITSLKEYVKLKFDSVQFLWLKREYVHQADKLANKARKLAEQLIIKPTPPKILLKSIRRLDDKRVIKIFKSFSKIQIINACLKISNQREQQILNGYLSSTMIKTHGKDNKLIGLGSKKRTFIIFVYSVLPDNEKKSFFNYLSHIDSNIDKKKFGSFLSVNVRINYINKIFKALKKNK